MMVIAESRTAVCLEFPSGLLYLVEAQDTQFFQGYFGNP